MSDFFNNLLIRSFPPARPGYSEVLRPRLPSLFEPPGGSDEIATPHADRRTEANTATSDNAVQRDESLVDETMQPPLTAVEPGHTIMEDVNREHVLHSQPSLEEAPTVLRGNVNNNRKIFSSIVVTRETERVTPSHPESRGTTNSSLTNIREPQSTVQSEPEKGASVKTVLGEHGIHPREIYVHNGSVSQPISVPFTGLPIPHPATTHQASIPEQSPTIKIRIGQIDVRAVQQIQEPQKSPVSRPAHMTLSEYLRRRNEGKR